MNESQPQSHQLGTKYRALPILIPILFFSPVLFAGLFWDDLILAVENYDKGQALPTIWAEIVEWTRGWISKGRFFPISTALSISIFHFNDFNNHWGYHVLQLIAIPLSFIPFLRAFSLNLKERIILALILCGCARFYPHYHDPYISYHIVIPVFCFFFFYSFILFDQYLKTGKIGKGIGALILYLLCLATYEIAYPLIAVFIIQLFTVTSKEKPRWGTWLLIVVLGVLMLAFQVWLRKQAQNMSYVGIEAGFDPIKIIRTFVIQSFAPTPLALHIGNGIRWLGDNNKGIPIESLLAGGAFLLIIAFCGLILWRYWKNRSRENMVLLIALVIWLTPAVLMAMSGKYQTELRWGTGYIPRYLQTFGIALLLLGLGKSFLTSKVGIVTLTTLVITVFTLNVFTLREINRGFAGARLLFNIVDDKEFLVDIDCHRLSLRDVYYDRLTLFDSLNADLEIYEAEQPYDGDHTMLIYEGHPGSEWAILGTYENNTLLNPHLLAGPELKLSIPPHEQMKPVREWKFFPLGAEKISYQDAVKSVSEGTPPLTPKLTASP